MSDKEVDTIKNYNNICVEQMNYIYKNVLMKKNHKNVLMPKNNNDINIVSSKIEEIDKEKETRGTLQITDINNITNINKITDIFINLSYNFIKIFEGKSGAVLYILTNKEKEKEKSVLKVYNVKGNLERNIREISIYCTFDKIQKDKKINLPFPKLLKTGFIIKDSDLYPETPYIITSFAEGENLMKILIKNADDNEFYHDKTIFYIIMKKILNGLLDINKLIPFSHEDLHPGNIMIDIKKDIKKDNNNKIIKDDNVNITIIDFDLSEIGDIHYENNKINPIKRPISRRFTKCVPDILNITIEKVFEKEKHIYKKFLKNFDKCSLSKTFGYNKIKLDRVVVIYYLFIFGYILKDNVVEKLEKQKQDLITCMINKKQDLITCVNTKQDLITEVIKKQSNNIEIKQGDKEIINKIDEKIKSKKDYTKDFFDDYETLTNIVSTDDSNIYFYENALKIFEGRYNSVNIVEKIVLDNTPIVGDIK
jgi:hypothetical protein